MKYVLFNLEFNSYLCADDDLFFQLSKIYEEALIFKTRDDAFAFLHSAKDKIRELGHDWAVREYCTI